MGFSDNIIFKMSNKTASSIEIKKSGAYNIFFKNLSNFSIMK